MPALRWLAENVQHRSDLEIEFEGASAFAPRKGHDSTVLYQATRELVLNSIRHSECDRITIRVQSEGSVDQILVEDDGIGFEPEAVVPDTEHLRHFGLFSVRERLRTIGGSLQIRSAPGQGTQAVLTVALADEDETDQGSRNEHPSTGR